LDPDDLDALLTDRTRLVAFPHASNVVAHVNPVAEITARARAAGAVSVVDGVSFAPHGLPDVAALGADIYLFSLYKTWGPHLGLMTVKRDLLDRMANQGHFFNAGDPHKVVTPAGPDHAQIAAAAGVVHYLDLLHAHHVEAPPSDQVADEPGPAERARRVAALIQRHEELLLAPLLAWLRDRNDVRLIGPDDPAVRAPTVSIVPTGKPIADVVRTLTEHKLMVGSGDFYAVRPLEGMGVALDPGVLRMSFVHYTTPAEVEQLIAGLAAALDG
ncbi:MAG: aminotransferase class V-fold PLP-dependent enzyme, partial [Acidimicrobiia bacterium]|nr:aminotransferase class V-fold PLP-dependent enzyme [Acidimicrobiia bacterium]